MFLRLPALCRIGPQTRMVQCRLVVLLALFALTGSVLTLLFSFFSSHSTPVTTVHSAVPTTAGISASLGMSVVGGLADDGDMPNRHAGVVMDDALMR